MKREPELGEDRVLEQMLGAARRDVPDPQRMQALSAALAVKLGGGGGGGGDAAPTDGGAGAAGTSGGVSLVAKASGAIGALLIGGALVYGARSPEPQPIVHAAAPIASASPALAPVERREPAPADPIPTVSIDDLPRAAPSVAVAPAPAPAASSSAEPESGESEMALFRRAQQSLAASPAQALELCSQHQRKFPRSAFGQEREVIAIDALVRLGRRSEAEARADQFARAYPGSAHNRRIDALLGR